jgi:aryl-alcohol dehydrogenase-like predicted oxidoreductase
VVEQSPYSLYDRRVERELLPMARSYGLGITVWSPLAGGLLTGKYRGESWPADGRLSPATSERWVDNHFTAGGVELPASALRRLDDISAPGRSIVPYYLDGDLADWRPHRYRW